MVSPPFKDFTASADHIESPDPLVLYPGHVPLIINIPIRQGITAVRLADLLSLRLALCFRIRATYGDAFCPNRCAGFAFVLRKEGLGYLPKYNEDS